MSAINREIHLASRPTGWPTADNFRLVETEVPKPGPGQLLVRNRYLSVDPYMRGRMNDVKSYVPPFALDAPLDGGALGEVVVSEADGFAPAMSCCTVSAGASTRSSTPAPPGSSTRTWRR